MKTVFADWTGTKLNIYFFSKKAGKLSLTDTITTELTGELSSEDLKPLSAAGTGQIFLSIPLDQLTLRELEFPFSDKTKISATLAYELAGDLLKSADNYTLDHILLGINGATSTVLAVCIEKSRLSAILQTFADAGIDPRVVTSIDLQINNGLTDDIINIEETSLEMRSSAAIQCITKPAVNLRRDELSYQGDIQRLRKSLRATAVMILLLISIFGANTFITASNAEREYQYLLKEVRTLYRGIFAEDRNIVDFKRQFMGNMNALVKQKDTLAGIELLEILKIIANKKDAGLLLHEFSADNRNIIIKGTALSFEEIEKARNSLATAFAGAKVIDSKAGSDGRISFTIIMENLKS